MCEIGLMEHMLQCTLAKVKHMRELKGDTQATPLVNEITRFSLNFLPKTDETIESSVRLANMKDGKAQIDFTQCLGCNVCSQLCKFGAIE